MRNLLGVFGAMIAIAAVTQFICAMLLFAYRTAISESGAASIEALTGAGTALAMSAYIFLMLGLLILHESLITYGTGGERAVES